MEANLASIADAKPAAVRPPDDFSLVLGGPLYQLYLRSRLAAPPIDLLGRRILASMMITWVPLAVLALIGGRAFGGVEVPFIKHVAVHARFLLALPLLLAAEPFAHHRIKTAVGQFTGRELVAPEDQPRFDAAV